MKSQLTKTETKTLAAAETILRRHLESFFLVGEALAEIRDERLYRATHETFEGYCADRWDFSRQRAYQLISAAETATAVSTTVDIRPEREKHVRPLLTVPKDHRGEVWRMAVDAAPKNEDGTPRMTERIVQEAVDRWHDRRKAEVPEPVPEPLTGRQAQVIDVDSRPVDRDEIGSDESDGIEGEVECPNCHHLVVPDPQDGACPYCLEPDLAAIDQFEEEEPAETPDDELLRCTEEAFREQFCGRLSIAAARLETLADKLRSSL